MKKLKNKVAIITGGAGGIGSGIGLAYVKEGAKVVIVDLDAEAGAETLKALQAYEPDSMFIEADLSDKAKLAEIVETTVETYGQIDILVNNAQASTMKPFEEIQQKDLDLAFDTGFYPTFYLMQYALPHLKEAQGSIINFASGAGLNGDVHQGSYAASKEAIRGLTRVVAREVGAEGVNVNLISPIAETPGIKQWAENFPEAYDKMIAKIPMRRLGDTEDDIGRAAVFLASEDARYMTGQTLMIDGGSTMLR